MGLFKQLFGGVDGYREVVRESYERHVDKARKSGMDYPHAVGLYGALVKHYMAAKLPVVETVIWVELEPFLAMKESVAIEAIVEYVIFQMNPRNARQEWLRYQINDALSYPSSIALDAMAIGGVIIEGVMHRIAWCDLL